jgi:hypothetical protein
MHVFGTHCNPGDLMLYRSMGLYPLIVGLIISIILGFLNVAMVLKMAYDIHVRKDPRYASGDKMILPDTHSNGSQDGHVAEQELLDNAELIAEETHDEVAQQALEITDVNMKPELVTGNPRYDTYVQSARPALLSFLVALAFLVFVIWWFADAQPKLVASGGGSLVDGAAEWGQPWLECLLSNAPDGQNACASIPQPYVPNEAMSWATEVMAACVGIFYFVALATRKSDYVRLFGQCRKAESDGL